MSPTTYARGILQVYYYATLPPSRDKTDLGNFVWRTVKNVVLSMSRQIESSSTKSVTQITTRITIITEDETSEIIEQQ